MNRHGLSLLLLALACSIAIPAKLGAEAGKLRLSINEKDGTYTIGTDEMANPVVRATAAAKVNGHWLHVTDYPRHEVSSMPANSALGAAKSWKIRSTGLNGVPDLIVELMIYGAAPYGEAQVSLRNATGQSLTVQALRVLEATAAPILDLGGPATADRVLSDSFSEDRPAVQVRDIANSVNDLHRGVGSQLVYNQQSKRSWFIGALTSDKFLSILRLRMAAGGGSPQIASYEVDSSGTTELMIENSLRKSPPEDRVELSLPLAPGSDIAGERMLFSVSDDYHQQLETYGQLIRQLHHPRVIRQVPLGWWSWTAYYFGLNDGTALTNAEWLSQHLKPLGYNFFHIDEGYQFARGEYSTPDAVPFPAGMAALERRVMMAGLTPGIWTAPFEVSERSWVYANHPEWLVHNAKGDPIHIGFVTGNTDALYALDPTHPGAQEYLKKTYSILANDWGIRYFKMDFMEDSGIEGYYHQPNTTALEAQRIGIGVIRAAVGEDVLLDKDGCEMLNPVGLVDMGRISQDTGHTFQASKDAATGMAARYFMNHNYYLSDPDAFSVSNQTVVDQSWHGGSKPLSQDEAEAGIMLSAISGGMFEIGDDLPMLGESPERLALVENRDLIDMAALGRASVPLDLMSYQPEDLQPSLFLLKENDRQSILTVFNWTEQARAHHISLEALGLAPNQNYDIADVLHAAESSSASGSLDVGQPPHSVRVLKITNPAVPARPPVATVKLPEGGKAGESLTLVAEPATNQDAIVHYLWDFGDGVTTEGASVSHSYTHAGKFQVKLFATGVGGLVGQSISPLEITGTISTTYHPEAKRRFSADVQ